MHYTLCMENERCMDYADGMPVKTGKTTQMVVRIDHDLDQRIEALVAQLSPAGMTMPRSEVIRAALLRGVEALEAEQAQSKPTKKTTKK